MIHTCFFYTFVSVCVPAMTLAGRQGLGT